MQPLLGVCISGIGSSAQRLQIKNKKKLSIHTTAAGPEIAALIFMLCLDLCIGQNSVFVRAKMPRVMRNGCCRIIRFALQRLGFEIPRRCKADVPVDWLTAVGSRIPLPALAHILKQHQYQPNGRSIDHRILSQCPAQFAADEILRGCRPGVHLYGSLRMRVVVYAAGTVSHLYYGRCRACPNLLDRPEFDCFGECSTMHTCASSGSHGRRACSVFVRRRFRR